MFDRLLTWFGIDMGIDLGTSNTLVSVRGEGIVLNEPSVVAVHKNTSKVLDNGNAVGWRAKEMIGKTPGSISAVRPLRDGVISDFEITEAMLSYFIRKVNSSRIMGPRVVIAVPSGITAVEKMRSSIQPNVLGRDGSIWFLNQWLRRWVLDFLLKKLEVPWWLILVVAPQRSPSFPWVILPPAIRSGWLAMTWMKESCHTCGTPTT